LNIGIRLKIQVFSFKRRGRGGLNIEHSTLNIEVKMKSEVRGEDHEEAACHWRFRTWSRMLQGRTGTGCPSYEEEVAFSAIYNPQSAIHDLFNRISSL
jgi:hypothetical protein